MAQENDSGMPPVETSPDRLLSPAPLVKLLAPPRKRRKWFWIVAAALVLLGFLFFRSYKGGTPPNANKKSLETAAAITTGQATTGDMPEYIEALGTVTPVHTISVYSQITGRVMTVSYREGQMVHQGDPLIEVDPRPYEAMLAQAQGNLAHDEGLLAEARIDLERYRTAFSKNAIARQQVEDQEQLVVQYEGSVKADQGAVDYDRTQLSYCHIAAPITGRVGLRLVDPGNTVFAGSASTLVVITQLQPITVVFNVAEDDLARVQAQLGAGKTLPVTAYERSDVKQISAGTLTSLDNQVDTTTGTVKFRAEFPNSDLALFPNQFVNAHLLVNTLRKATLVPSAAVQYNGASAFVYVVNSDDTVSVQPVTPLTGNDQSTAVTGIKPGESVATSGFDRLENGAKVAIRSQPGGQTNTGQPGAPAPTNSTSKP